MPDFTKANAPSGTMIAMAITAPMMTCFSCSRLTAAQRRARGIVVRALRRFELARLALALVRIEEALADADRLGGHLDELVVLDVGDRLLQAHALRRRQANALVLARGAEVGELLRLQGIDLEVLGLRILA